MKTIIMLIACLAISFLSATTLVEGTVSGTWTIQESPYTINGNIQVLADSNLFIEAGVEVYFSDNYSIRVMGNLEILGTAANPIVFDTNNFADFYDMTTSAGGWKGIILDNQAANDVHAIIRHAEFKHVKDISEHAHYAAIQALSYDNLSVSNCHIHKNKSLGIVLEDSDAIIDSVIINDCDYDSYGAGLKITDNAAPTISNSLIYDNNSTDYGAGVFCDSAQPVFYNTKIVNNNASLRGGGIYAIGSELTLINNLIANNSSDKGGGLLINDATLKLINSTIAYNYAQTNGGGIYLLEASPIISNSILWANQHLDNNQQVYLHENGSDPVISFSLVDGGFNNIVGPGAGDYSMLNYTDNTLLNPLFVRPPLHAGDAASARLADFGIQDISPAKNSANNQAYLFFYPLADLAGELRFVEQTIDMGAYENPFITPVDDPLTPSVTSILLYPNPYAMSSATGINIRVNNEHNTNFSVTIYNIRGQKISDLGSHSANNQINWQPHASLSSGIYFARVVTSKKVSTKKILILK